MPEEPGVLTDVMQEGVVYSYDLTNDATSFRISTQQSCLAIVGASLIRHEHELTCLIVAGEQPPNPSDECILRDHPQMRHPTKGRESFEPDPHYGLEDRYLESLPGFARVVLGTRFDLSGNFYDVRYVNLDLGRSYAVFTDDDAIFPPAIHYSERDEIRKSALHELDRYKELFSAAAALMYLPVMFVAETKRVQETQFVTDLGTDRDEKEVREAVSELGKDEVPFTRMVRCLAAARTTTATLDRNLEPPPLTFKSEGYWKPLPLGKVGEDKSGNPIVGKTWVQRIESWSAESPASFLIRRQTVKPKGAEPGTVYVMRSPSHEVDLYKIGFTRRGAEERARDLGAATGVPLPFAVIASWEVGDCSGVEREVHRKLDERRINPRREFFYASLSEIIATIESVVASETLESGHVSLG